MEFVKILSSATCRFLPSFLPPALQGIARALYPHALSSLSPFATPTLSSSLSTLLSPVVEAEEEVLAMESIGS